MTNLQKYTRKLTPNEAMLRFMSQYIGLHEVPGKEDNPVILQMSQDLGFENIKHDEDAWCSISLNWVAWNVGCEMSSSPLARSWADVGRLITDPIPGDVVVFWRGSPTGWQGHAGLFTGFTLTGNIWTLAGNQGNEFNISSQDIHRKICFRRLDYKNAA